MRSTSPSVLVIRLDAIGDALALAPLLAALRTRSIPADLVLCRANARALSGSAARETYEAPFALRRGDAANLALVADFGETLGQRGYECVLVATEDPNGYRLARAIGAPQRVGFIHPWGKPLKSLWVRTQLTRSVARSAGLDSQAPHECEVLFRLGASILGQDAKPTRDLTLLRPLVLDREPAPDPRVLFQVTDKWERLGIATDDVVSAARLVGSAGAVRAVASASESAYARAFSDASGIPVEHFDSLEPWKAAIGAARALVAPDSGALHVAGMVGTPTVAVFPAHRRFELQAARWAPWAAPYRIVEAAAGWPQRAVDALASL